MINHHIQLLPQITFQKETAAVKDNVVFIDYFRPLYSSHSMYLVQAGNFKSFIFIYYYSYVWLFFLQVCIVPCVCCALWSLMKALGSMELELQTSMSHHVSTELKHSGKTINALHCWDRPHTLMLRICRFICLNYLFILFV